MAEQYRREIHQFTDEAKADSLNRESADMHHRMLALDGMTGWAYFWYVKEAI